MYNRRVWAKLEVKIFSSDNFGENIGDKFTKLKVDFWVDGWVLTIRFEQFSNLFETS